MTAAPQLFVGADDLDTPDAWVEVVRQEMVRRIELLERLNQDKEARAIALAAWRADVALWVMDCGWGLDPRNVPKGLPSLIPFIPWPRQVEFLHWLTERWQQGEPWLVEKTRDCGASYLVVLWQLHRFLFSPGWVGTLASADAPLVDELGDPDSLFEKMRIVLRQQPEWALPAGWDERFHSNKMRLINPATGATLTGEAGDEIGRGGRSSMIVVDEFAVVKRAEKAAAAMSFNSDCWGVVSTVRGLGNEFARMRHSGEIPVFTFRWQDDPRKSPDWLAEKKRQWKHQPLVVAQEIERDYQAGEVGTFIPGRWVQAAVGLAIQGVGQVCAGLDVADTGSAQSVYVARKGPRVLRVVSWSGSNTTQTTLRAMALAEEDGAGVVYYDDIGVGAGVRAAVESMTRATVVRFVGVNVGDPAKDRDRFANLKAELWWHVRTRFERTYEMVERDGTWELADHDAEELIALPDSGAELLVAQLCLPRVIYTENGKVRVEPKDQLARRGVPSPDHADALILAFATSYGWDWL